MNIESLSVESQQNLALIRDRARGRKIIFVSGNFNIVHPGHLRLLKFAAECGDFLVVGVLGNIGGHQALLDAKYRLEGVQSITWVDYGFILRDRPEAFVRQLSPAIVVKGKEHEERYNPELEILRGYGGKLLFSSGDNSFFLAELLKN